MSKNFNFGQKIEFFAKISTLIKKIGCLAKIWIFGQNLDFWPKFGFLAKISILIK